MNLHFFSRTARRHATTKKKMSKKKTKEKKSLSKLISAGYHDTVRKIIRDTERSGEKIDEVNANGDGPLAWAFHVSNLETIRLILQSPAIDVADQKIMGQHPLAFLFTMLPYEKFASNVCRAIVESPRIDPSLLRFPESALHILVERTDTQRWAYDALLTHPKIDSNIRNSRDFTALDLAVITGSAEKVRLLTRVVVVRLDVDEKTGYVSVAVAVVADPVDINSQCPSVGYTALHRILNVEEKFEGNRTEVVRHLASDPRFRVDLVDVYGFTPLLRAVHPKWFSPEIIRLLASVPGVNHDHITKNGRTALHLAVALGKPGIVDIVLRYLPRLDVNKRDFKGHAPLMLRDISSDTLLSLASDPRVDHNVTDLDGCTILHHATDPSIPCFDDRGRVHFILRHLRVDSTLRNANGDTALDVAQYHGNLDAFRRLAREQEPFDPRTELLNWYDRAKMMFMSAECAWCEKEASRYCGGCNMKRYCCTECARLDWKKHKAVCRVLSQIRSMYKSM